MSAGRSAGMYFGWQVAIYFMISAVTIYGFGYFEGALGGPLDNLFLNMALYVATAFVAAMSFGAVLSIGAPAKPFGSLHLLAVAIVTSALVHALLMVGSVLGNASSATRLGIVVIYVGVLGAISASALRRFA